LGEANVFAADGGGKLGRAARAGACESDGAMSNKEERARNRRIAEVRKLMKQSPHAYFWKAIRWQEKHWQGIGLDKNWRFGS
jgi:hypothetical protein